MSRPADLTYIELAEVASTNTYVKQHAANLPDLAVVYAVSQTAGRGQRGNSWESEPGKNLTFSFLLKRPRVDVTAQFALSEAVSLAMLDVLDTLTPDIRVKWPNDIYHCDNKLAGILIEHSLQGRDIDYMVAGIGLNVNQRRFVSDAPNPVSLVNITGREHDLLPLLRSLGDALASRCREAETDRTALHDTYLRRLYRRDGRQHGFSRPDGTPVSAAIVDVKPEGNLVLLHSDGSRHSYAFKEIIYNL